MRKTKKDMTINAERSLVIKKLKGIDNLSILQEIRSYLDKVEQYNLEIEEAERDVAAGNVISNDEAKRRLSKWRKKGR
jgi:hypothetical protein